MGSPTLAYACFEDMSVGMLPFVNLNEGAEGVENHSFFGHDFLILKDIKRPLSRPVFSQVLFNPVVSGALNRGRQMEFLRI